jgi:hypothetical protein
MHADGEDQQDQAYDPLLLSHDGDERPCRDEAKPVGPASSFLTHDAAIHAFARNDVPICDASCNVFAGNFRRITFGARSAAYGF